MDEKPPFWALPLLVRHYLGTLSDFMQLPQSGLASDSDVYKAVNINFTLLKSDIKTK